MISHEKMKELNTLQNQLFMIGKGFSEGSITENEYIKKRDKLQAKIKMIQQPGTVTMSQEKWRETTVKRLDVLFNRIWEALEKDKLVKIEEEFYNTPDGKIDMNTKRISFIINE